MSNSSDSRLWLRPFLWYVRPRLENESVIGWWEKRRIPYNLLLLVWGLIYVLVEHYYLPKMRGWPVFGGYGWGAFESLIILLQVASNVWYTGGWIVEGLLVLIARRRFRWFGPVALAAGTLFSFVFAAWMYEQPWFFAMPHA